MERLRGKLTYANVMATIAVFLVLGGGTAFAAKEALPAKNSVGTRQLKPGSVTAKKLSNSAKVALMGAPGAQGLRGATGAEGPRGPVGSTGAAGTPETSAPLAIDATAPEQPLPSTTSFLSLEGRTGWTAPEEDPGLLIAELELTLATTGTGGGGIGGFEYCGGSVEVFDDGEPVTTLQLGVEELTPNDTTLTTHRVSSAPVALRLTDPTQTQSVTAKFDSNPASECAAGSKFDGLRIIVQPLG